MIRQHPLQKEFKDNHGNSPPFYYDETSHGPTWSQRYVEWLEDLVQKSRTRPDLNNCAGDGFHREEV